MNKPKLQLIKSGNVVYMPNARPKRYRLIPTERVVGSERIYRVIGPSGITVEGSLSACTDFAVSRNIELDMWNPGPV
jgi:hypothetical protein